MSASRAVARGACSRFSFARFDNRAQGSLARLGSIYLFRPFTPKTHPTFSQALSGLVKSLRIRRVEEAVYWLQYLDTFPDARQRS
jgi:hypothetical protein